MRFQALLCATVLALFSAAFTRAQTSWSETSRILLDESLSYDGRDGWVLQGGPWMGSLGEEGFGDHTIRIDPGADYLVAAVCDTACADLDLRVFGPDGAQVGADIDERPRPIVDVSPSRRGAHRVRVDMAACRREPCRYAVALFRAEG